MHTILKYHTEFLKNYHQIEKWKSINRKINVSRVDNNPELNHLKELYANTRYIRYDEMVESIKQVISRLDKSHPYYLFFPLLYPFKIGSENAIILECFEELQTLNICGVITSNGDIIDKNDNVDLLIIDDAIYSGLSSIHIINSFTNVFKNFTMINFVINDSLKSNIVSSINSKDVQITFNNHTTHKSVIDLIYNIIVKGVQIDNPNVLRGRLINKLGVHSDIPAIYFDHKIHNTLIQLYSDDLFEKDHYPNRLPAQLIEQIHQNIFNN